MQLCGVEPRSELRQKASGIENELKHRAWKRFDTIKSCFIDILSFKNWLPWHDMTLGDDIRLLKYKSLFFHAFICSYIHSSIHLFVCSFFRSFIRSFVRSFIIFSHNCLPGQRGIELRVCSFINIRSSFRGALQQGNEPSTVFDFCWPFYVITALNSNHFLQYESEKEEKRIEVSIVFKYLGSLGCTSEGGNKRNVFLL